MDKDKKRILITGGAGFLGTHLCEKYVKEGHIVLCFDNFLNGSLNNIRGLLNHKNFKLINGDIRNFDLLEKLVPDVDVIINLAAQIHVDRSIIEPRLTYDINLFGTINLLELARMHDVNRVIHASTSEVYGSAKYIPMDEGHPLDPPHPYGASKVAADRLCAAYHHTYGLNVNILRSFNIFGQFQKDYGYGSVISLFARRISDNLSPVIYGDGKQTRDYLYIKDIVRAYDMVLNHNGNLSGKPINFGTGKEISILDLANMTIKLLGKDGKVKPTFLEARPGEVLRLCADITRAKDILGWEPQWKFEDALEEYLNWYTNYKSEAPWARPFEG